MVDNGIGIVAHDAAVALVARLGPAGLGLITPLLAVRRGRLRRSARRLLRALQPQHQLDQLLAAQPLKIASAHPARESAKPDPRKGVGNYAGWGWYYLSTVLDDFSRFIVAWKLCATMQATDVTETLDLALAASGLDQVTIAHRPRLLTDNGASYIAGDLAEWLDGKGMKHVRGAPYHPQTQGKIERWHQTLKNRILLEHYYLPGDLEAQVRAFVEHYNHGRYHESLDNLTPADVYFGRGQTILIERERIKRQTIANRRLQHHAQAA